MMRIVHVVATTRFAGVERFVVRLANAQAAHGHEVRVFGGHPVLMRAALHREVGHAAVPVWPVAAARLARLRPRPDLVNAHMTAAEAAAAVSMPLTRAAVVATCHFAHPRAAGSGWLRRPVAAAVSRPVAAQLAISHYVAGCLEGPSTVVHPGLDPRPGPVGPRGRTVLLAQRLEPEKSTADGLRIFARSGLAAHGWRLQVAGEGRERDRLAPLAQQLGIGEATDLLGHRADVERLMDAAGVLLAPTRVEGLGLTVVEAMAGGLPVLAAALGGHLETVGATPGGRLYRDLDEAAALLAALAGDPAGRAAYGLALQETQRQLFTVEAQYAATDAVYRRVLQDRR